MSEQLRNGGPTGDPGLARLYREATREEPPARLDAAILAAAHRDADARPRPLGSSWLRSWRLPVSIAAVAVLTVSVVMLMVEEEGGQRLVDPRHNVPKAAPEKPAAMGDRASALSKPAGPAPPAAAPAAKPPDRFETTAEIRSAKKGVAREAGQPPATAVPPVATPQPFPKTPRSTVSSGQRAGEPEAARQPESAESAAPPPAATRKPQMPSGSTPTPNDISAGIGSSSRAAPAGTLAEGTARADARETPEAPSGRLRAPPPASARDSASSTIGIRELSQQEPPAPSGRVAPQAAAPGPAAKPAPAIRQTALVRDYEHQPPEKWIEKIAELKRDGKTTEADEMLAEFKKRFPEHPLPATLR